MERAKAAAPESQAGAKVPMEPVGNLLPRLEQPQVPAETRQPEGPESSPTPAGAGEEAAGAGREPSSEKQLPSPRPGPLRVPPLSLGYGAFGGLGSACPEPRSPGPLSAETPRNSEAPGAEPASGAWAPIELQVDVLVKPVGAAGGSSTPSPRPSTRFLTVPVPESPAFSRSAAPAHQLLQRAPSPGGTWGRGSRLAAARTESGRDAEGPASPAEGSADSPSSRTCCRCKELGLEKEGAALLPCAELHRDKKLPRAVTHLGLSMYMKSLRRALAVMAVLLAVSGVVIVVLASRAGARCQPCPPGWVLSEEHCYYLSAEAQAWEASQAFCSAYHATLPLLSHTQDLLSRYPVSKHSWVGARRGPQGWHWIDGAPMPPQLLPEDGENNSDINCGALEEGTLVAANCSTPRPWVCAKGTQ
ncbi:killer cell lectin-like receptor subfamily G member 2 isoform X3 [Saimiri boliviensis]|uniref:killer cell lectin-like receptor subfamily G member 2 isoform X3 n=1 Tax=Saimiri boliviensis TaxID=27679 RepID=UPI003D78ADDE